ncbi:hypothetical protein NZD85_09140 [Empedobacter stercoris]|uniref:hypothetical protein n=1 Tax=Empedobacter stercoris TaxID=1628248 RepID=UPI001CE1E45F|nr:hypothetical protein [Empedobacter stercoris]MCA4782142.1 hypothetical protein [Empedobacter stercoris]UWX66066.1 hypothetical protein NZD85_09140 [Empedobacter stercoris]
MKIEKRSFFIVLSFLMILLGLIFPLILPENFYFDANIIVSDLGNEKGVIGSYPFTMLFYWITGLGKLPFSLLAIIQIPILLLLIWFIGIPNNFSTLNIKNSLIYLSFLMLVIFIGQPSKEFITFIFAAIIVYIFKYNYFSLGISILLSTLFFIIFGGVFRPYFAFMPFIACAIYFITRIRFTNRWILSLFLGFSVLILLSFLYQLGKGEFFSEMSRETINEIRLNSGDENADTMIVSPIPVTNIFTEAFATLYGFLTVNFPINALRFFYKPQVFAFVIWQILLTWIVIVRFGYLLKEYPNRKKDLWLMCLLLSYFVVQGIFEPDLGSAVRHKIGILPLIYYLFYYDDFKRKI